MSDRDVFFEIYVPNADQFEDSSLLDAAQAIIYVFNLDRKDTFEYIAKVSMLYSSTQ